MKRMDAELHRLSEAFLEERESFWGFHEEFIKRWTRLAPGALSDADRKRWNEIYFWILTSVPDPVSAEDHARGTIGEAELRSRLRGHPLLASPR
ncbi:MAG TPA: hypothetical protein VFU23_11385 [Gemmatimonadales bacterium]|nr:hypothetical protein [Gemmatimonadales bacterium]